MKTLTTLNLDSNNVTSIGAQYIGNALTHNTVGSVIH